MATVASSPSVPLFSDSTDLTPSDAAAVAEIGIETDDCEHESTAITSDSKAVLEHFTKK